MLCPIPTIELLQKLALESTLEVFDRIYRNLGTSSITGALSESGIRIVQEIGT
jgi:hypothetical protein